MLLIGIAGGFRLAVWLLLFALIGLSGTAAAQALKLPSSGDNSGAQSSPGFYDRFVKGHLYLRPEASYLDFSHLKSSDLKLSKVRFPASLAIQNGRIPGAKATIEDQTVPTLSLGYYLPHTGRHLSLETLLGAPLDIHFIAQRGPLRDRSLAPTADLGNLINGSGPLSQILKNLLGGLGSGVNALTGLLNTGIPPLGRNLGTVKSLPITLTLLYHPFPDAFIRPYFGGGGIYLYNYDAKITNGVLTEEGDPGFSVSSTPGYLLEAGVDIGGGGAKPGFFAFGDVRYIGGATVTSRLTNVHVRVRNAALADALGAIGYGDDIRVGDAKIRLHLNTFIYSAGIGYRF